MSRYKYNIDSMKIMIILDIVQKDKNDSIYTMLLWPFRKVLNKYYEVFPEGDSL